MDGESYIGYWLSLIGHFELVILNWAFGDEWDRFG